MAERNSAKENEIIQTDFLPSVSTGDDLRSRQLYFSLSKSMERARKIDIIVAFLMESGVRLILKDLKAAAARGVSIRILTGNYLGITQPSALYLVKKELGSNVELRFYSEKGRSFHPKAYFLHHETYTDVFIGSSNISKSALLSGIEWNYHFNNLFDSASYTDLYSTFEDLYFNHSIVIDDNELKRYSQNWHRPAASNILDQYDEIDPQKEKGRPLFEPRGAQVEALCALENTRAEGSNKALVMAATGIGKTYLAAFDSQGYDRVLFVAHREEILKQAAVSFRNVRNSDEYGFFNGDEKCISKPVIFASVATLGRDEYLSEAYFPRDYFQYIIVDEFHHAVNSQYKRIMEYFRPNFLLGLTATPERMDGKNIYELCDYNVAYEIGLKEGINRGMLVPFRYYGIYDDTDYSKLHVVRGKYDEKELNETYIGNAYRHDLVYKYYSKYGSKQALGFCCSRAHAEEMAREFSKRGIPSAAVYSNADGEYSANREEAIANLKSGKIRVIFSVDMFNEGVDITSVDMVMFLRPTESPVIFMQQLGRGLRRCDGKDYLNVLDFIGNYHKAGNVRFLLTDRTRGTKEFQYSKHDDYPDNCIIDFDMRLIDLFKEMDTKQLKVKDQIVQEYYRVKETIGKRPSRVELFTCMDDEIYRLAIAHSKDNPFKNYLSFLHELHELSADEMRLYNGIGREFLELIETTNMSKVYKMPVLMAFYNGGNVRLCVTKDELLDSWKMFFGQNGNWKDLDKGITYEKYLAIKDSDHLKKIIQMPVHFLQESGKGYFGPKAGYALTIKEELSPIVKEAAFAEHMRDIVEYRTFDYYQRRYLLQKAN